MTWFLGTPLLNKMKIFIAVLALLYSAGFTGSAFFGPRIVLDIAASTEDSYWDSFWKGRNSQARLGPDALLPTKLPGPLDEWGGAKSHSIAVAFEAPEGEYRFSLYSYDQHDTAPPTLRLSVDGREVSEAPLPQGRRLDLPYKIGEYLTTYEKEFPLASGPHTLQIANTRGSWVALGGMRLEKTGGAVPQLKWYARRFAGNAYAHAFSLAILLLWVRFLSAKLFMREKKRYKAADTILTAATSDSSIGAILFAFSFLLAVWYLGEWKGTPQFYQHTFAPSMMWACGKGFATPQYNSIAPLYDFINQQTQVFSCGDIPADIKLESHDEFTMVHLYLAYAVALCWYIFGSTWVALYPLYGLLYSVTSTASYYIFRLGAGKKAAFLGAVYIILSPLHISMLPHLRDYSKAPFILLICLLIGRISFQNTLQRKQFLTVSALIGIVEGLGFGCRADLLAMIPLILLAINIISPGFDKKSLQTKLAGSLIVMAVVALFAAPIITFNKGNNGHAIVMGMARGFDRLLRIETPIVYQVNYNYHDGYTLNLVNVYSYLGGSGKEYAPFELGSIEYSKANIPFIVEAALTFPADVLTRVAAAVRNVSDLPFSADGRLPVGLALATTPGAERGYGIIYHNFKEPLYGFGIYIALLVIYMLFLYDLRIGAGVLAIYLYFAGYPALQYFTRHVFHLEFITVFFVLLLFRFAAVAMSRCSNYPLESLRVNNVPRVLKVTGLYLSIFVVLAAVFYSFRFAQEKSLERLFSEIEGFELSAPIATELERKEVDGKNRVVVKVARVAPVEKNGFAAAYIYAQIDHSKCPQSTGFMETEYSGWYNFKEKIASDSHVATGVSKYYFPVSYSIYGNFEGILVDEYAAKCATIKKALKSPKLPLYLYLPENWRAERLYMSLK
jgi:hypothetical protein